MKSKLICILLMVFSISFQLHSQGQELSKKEQKAKLESLLDEFGLQHVRKNRGDLLSGVERRRTEIARCLATNPHFILLDEPFAFPDPEDPPFSFRVSIVDLEFS